ncbi:hypothetical protein FRB99_008782 [Tulasnella sp. 403]|nr:hypothetical protein FRB99_008782 [Tulasnella sp. 403]
MHHCHTTPGALKLPLAQAESFEYVREVREGRTNSNTPPNDKATVKLLRKNVPMTWDGSCEVDALTAVGLWYLYEQDTICRERLVTETLGGVSLFRKKLWKTWYPEGYLEAPRGSTWPFLFLGPYGPGLYPDAFFSASPTTSSITIGIRTLWSEMPYPSSEDSHYQIGRDRQAY